MKDFSPCISLPIPNASLIIAIRLVWGSMRPRRGTGTGPDSSTQASKHPLRKKCCRSKKLCNSMLHFNQASPLLGICYQSVRSLCCTYSKAVTATASTPLSHRGGDRRVRVCRNEECRELCFWADDCLVWWYSSCVSINVEGGARTSDHPQTTHTRHLWRLRSLPAVKTIENVLSDRRSVCVWLGYDCVWAMRANLRQQRACSERHQDRGKEEGREEGGSNILLAWVNRNTKIILHLLELASVAQCI